MTIYTLFRDLIIKREICMSVLMFPGQGSQSKGMGAALFPLFPNEVNQADEILGYSITELCLNDPMHKLSNTAYTQPCLYTIEVLSFLALSRESTQPTWLIGHSLGEYAALFAAGAFDFATGLQLVLKRGELMSQAHSGGMLAVLNLSQDRIQTILSNNGIDSIDFANFNSTLQVVLSGPSEDILKANDLLSKEASMCIPLNTSGAFHSRYMKEASLAFEQFLLRFQFNPLQTKVISNVTAQPYTDSTIKANLIKQIISPVRWAETISYLKRMGESDFIEIGPGKVLTRLISQID